MSTRNPISEREMAKRKAVLQAVRSLEAMNEDDRRAAPTRAGKVATKGVCLHLVEEKDVNTYMLSPNWSNKNWRVAVWTVLAAVAARHDPSMTGCIEGKDPSPQIRHLPKVRELALALNIPFLWVFDAVQCHEKREKPGVVGHCDIRDLLESVGASECLLDFDSDEPGQPTKALRGPALLAWLEGVRDAIEALAACNLHLNKSEDSGINDAVARACGVPEFFVAISMEQWLDGPEFTITSIVAGLEWLKQRKIPHEHFQARKEAS